MSTPPNNPVTDPPPTGSGVAFGTGLEDAPYVTHPVAPVGGCIKARIEDFLVDEVPMYSPCGEGEHIYMLVEKHGLSTTEMLQILTQHFGVGKKEIGFAGMKDKWAITRQVVSVHAPGRTPEDFPMLRDDRVRILWTDLHTNKLRRGHLVGNRFSIRIREVDPLRVNDVYRMLRYLSATGMPNYYGQQRFGARMNNHEAGRLLLMKDYRGLLDLLLGPDDSGMNAEARALYGQGEYAKAIEHYGPGMRTERQALRALARGRRPADAVNAVDEMQRQFWVTAFQSSIFNAVCAQRVRDEKLGALEVGDIAFKHDSGASFRVDASVVEDPSTAGRLKAFEVSPSGPMVGVKAMMADGAPGRIEESIVAARGVPMEAYERITKSFGDAVAGGRRPLRVPIVDPEVESGVDEHGTFIRCAFELPKGSFATMALREIMKTEVMECPRTVAKELAGEQTDE